MSTISANYHMRDWKETTIFEQASGAKLTQVIAAFEYEGQLQGPTKLGLLLQYNPDQTGIYTGWELFEGAFSGQPAAITFRIQGTFDPKGVEAQANSVAGSGSGSLADHQLAYSVEFKGHGPYPIQIEITEQ